MKEELTLVGVIHSELKMLEDCPKQEHENAPEATIEIFNDFINAAKDLKPGDAIILFTWLHKADRKILKTKPRNNMNLPLTGVFSTRSPDRPNPIGIHFVRLVEVEQPNLFKVSGLEALDKTPLIDIKPDLWRK